MPRPGGWRHGSSGSGLEEYAQHTGHADLIRERIDGFTGS
ncbi:DUF664 domain-containing protein [Catellatospora methionotrophica]